MFRSVIILLTLMAVPLHANLGEIVAQCVKRYGNPIGYSEASKKSPFGTVAFSAGKFTLLIFLLDTKEVGARVSKTDKTAFTDAEIKTIMDADSDPQSPWTVTTSAVPECQEWTRGDKASVIYDKAKHILIFTSDAMATVMKADLKMRSDAVGVGTAPAQSATSTPTTNAPADK